MQGPIANIPPELIYHVASLLPIKALFSAALVCRRWRTLLLASPDLWTCIRIALGASRVEQKNPHRSDVWQPLFVACFKRSLDLPLSVCLLIGDYISSAGRAILGPVSALLCDNMHRVKSLSVTLRPGERSSDNVPKYLLTQAPILESFSLRARPASNWIHIQQLFSGYAPRLDRVELSGDIMLAAQPLLRFPSITKFCYKGETMEVGDLLAQLPALQQLTLDTEIEILSLLHPCTMPLDVQIRAQEEWDASIYFPRARSICYALGTPHVANDWDVSKANLLVTLRLIGSRPIKVLDMRLSRLCVRPSTGTDFDIVRMTVKADGAVIAVDLDWIRQSPLLVSTLNLGALERLVLHEGIWDDLMDLELPCLRELTIQLRRTLEWWPLMSPRVARQPWALATLRLSRSPAVEEPASCKNGELPSLKATDIAALITRNFEPSALEKIVLRGWELAEPGAADLRAVAPRAVIRFEDEIACDDWVKPAGWPTRYVESEGLQL